MEDRNLYGRAVDPHKRGKHDTFSSAMSSALGELLVERNGFFDTLVDEWKKLFPDLPVRPGRYEGGRIYLYVRNAPTLFLMRPKLASIKRRLAALPGAPARIDLGLEVHAS